MSGKKVLITGGSGMVGSLVLKHALADDRVSSIVSLVRRRSSASDSKLNEIVVDDFSDLRLTEDKL